MFQHFIRDALAEFKRAGYVDKVKACITPESLPSGHEELLAFLYHQITDIAGMPNNKLIHSWSTYIKFAIGRHM